ncbi:outer membrane protein transport protein [Pseudomonas sp. UL073]|uniref:Outer membrane protein transport protein n=1 Tax=Zestomonas insulae TaxID=2809017 RepID=A0ABS2IBH3_9GAMM|nr:outer membrane protein transport protein [Pseudomonas insulae]MBM7059513.1 outer membrane protein transport protein [Pseudomonas insulae]
MKQVWFKSTLALTISALSTYSLAGGFAINEQSISGMGTSYAGRSSSADDASTVFGNPAGMSRLKREQVSFGAAAIIAKTDIDHASGTFAGSNDGDMVPFTAVPMGYYVKPIDDQWAFGLGVYVPFGLITDYEGGFQGRFYGDYSEVRVITTQPTVSYRFNDQLSLGLGLTINRIDGKLESAVASPIPGGAESRVKIKGDDTAVGYNIGVLYEFTPQTRAGLTYHSKVDYTLEGDTKISGNNPALGNFGIGAYGKYDASLDLTTPESVDLSLTHDIDERWTVYAGSTFTRWSRLKDITVENEGVRAGPASATFGTITEEQNWHDTWSYAVGAAYKLNPEWVLRAGLAFDQSPVNNQDRSPRIPSNDRKAFSLGAAWSPNEDITVDLAYSYLQEDDAKINDVKAGKGAYRATYENSAHGLGAQLTYRF